MANTTIKIKRSFANSVPSILGEGELAYSYLSNTLFIGSSANTPISIALANVDGRLLAVEASSSIATLAYNRANQAYDLADSAVTQSYYANVVAVSAISQVAVAANTVRVSQNGTGTLSNKQLNFVDTATATFSVSDALNGNANISAAVAANLGITSLSTDYVSFTQLPYTSGPSYNEGRMWYNQNAHSVQFQTDFPAFDAVPGQIEYIRVYNNTGAQIALGKPVYITGVKGSSNPIDSRILSVALADATDVLKKDVIGLTGHNIPNGSEGFVVARGPLYGLDTSALNSDQRFHLGPSPGELIPYAPEYPYWPTDLGTCLVVDPTVGTVYVDIFDHSIERLRLESDGYVGGNFTIEGSLTVLGEQFSVSKNSLKVGGKYLYLSAGDTIDAGNTTFTGTGLDDLSFRGTYEGDPASTSYYVRIDSVGIDDTFEWSFNSSFSPLQGSNIVITTARQPLANGISVQFNSVRGHTVGDKWAGVAYTSNLDFGIIGHYNDGTYTHAGLFRDATDGEFKFFNRYRTEPEEENIDVSNSTFQLGNVRVEKITANSFFADGVNLLSAINSAANASAVYANGTLRVSNAPINFVNTSTIRATVSGSGLANVSFDLIGSGGIASFPVVATGQTTVSANGLTFVNSATVGITVTQGTSGNANISFTTLAGGGTVTQVGTGLGLTGGPITTSGTVSANIASTTVQGVTKLIDSVTSTDAANAATAASVRTAFNQGTSAFGQANAAFTQANSANSIAISAYGQANAAFAAANNAANTVRVSANGGSTLSAKQLNFVNSSNVLVTITDSGTGNANVSFATNISATEILDKIKTVDGIGSGLDADLLDGKTGNNYGRLVVTTADGGASDANYWAKIATANTGTTQFSDASILFAVTTRNNDPAGTAIVSATFRSSSTGTNPKVDVKILELHNPGWTSTLSIGEDSFKVISDGWSTDMELWFQKKSLYSSFNFYVISENIRSSAVITYNDGATWQLAEPTGAVNNVRSTLSILPSSSTSRILYSNGYSVATNTNLTFNETTQLFSVGSTLRANASSGRVGIGTDTSLTSKVFVDDIVTSTTQNEAGLTTRLSVQQSSGSVSKWSIGTTASVDNWGTSTGYVSGYNTYIPIRVPMPAGDVRAYNIGSIIEIPGGGNVNAFYNYFVSNPSISTGNTISNLYGFYVSDITSGNTDYGFFSNMTVGANKWGIYTNTANNYFGGSLGIGVTTELDRYKLNVLGDSKVTGNTVIVNSTAGDALRITQTGTGNVIIFEDETNPDSTPFVIRATGDVGIGTVNPQYKLEVNGAFAATTKSFVIDHPTKPGKRLRYASLEGPENGVYVRGRNIGSSIIYLPEYWHALVDEESITVSLTPIGKNQNVFVDSVSPYAIIVASDLPSQNVDFFYVVFAERKDVDKLQIEV